MTKRREGPLASHAVPPPPAPPPALRTDLLSSLDIQQREEERTSFSFWRGRSVITRIGLSLLVLVGLWICLSVGALELGLVPDSAATGTADAIALRAAWQATTMSHAATETILALTPSDTPTAPPTSTITPTPSATDTPTETAVPSETSPPPTPKVQPTWPPTETISPKLTDIPITSWPRDTYYTTTGANLRPCPQATIACQPITTLASGAAFDVTGIVRGETISGSAIWFKGSADGHEGFIHSSILATSDPAVVVPPRVVATPLPAQVAPVPPPVVRPPSAGLSAGQSSGGAISLPGSEPSAICNDGDYSYSAHRRGTCSHHGGVRTWLKDLPP